MATKLNEYLTTEINVLENEIIERPATKTEIEAIQKAKKIEDAREIEAKAKAEARLSALAKLADLGLTAEEIAAL